jgi:protein tyrosine/serine phosphatase
LSAADAGLDALRGEERILDWEGALNARDTGGLPTDHGGRVRHGALVRSDVLTRLTPSGRQALVDHGVRTIIDVRGGNELDRDEGKYPFGDSNHGVRYLNVPFVVGRPDDEREMLHARYQAAKDREELNRIDLDAHADGIAAIVSAIADAEPGGVLVHCHAGKDRTGTIVALILSLLGVSDDDIADDYALTAINLEPLIIDWLDEMSQDETERDRLRGLATPRREAMLDLLAYVRENYGSAEQYLLSAGVTARHIVRLRERLVDAHEGND